jgi:hypothetical protein
MGQPPPIFAPKLMFNLNDGLMLGCWVWIILILFIGFCVTPWWFIPSIVIGTIIWHILFDKRQY